MIDCKDTTLKNESLIFIITLLKNFTDFLQ